MHIVVIGGHDRMHRAYKGICSKQGHCVKIYTQKPVEFEKVIGHPDEIVVFTNMVSHQMVNVAVKVAKNKNIPLIRRHSCSATSLSQVLKQFDECVRIAN